jgi:hypothetical protein
VIDLSNFFYDMFALLFKVSYFVVFLGCWLGNEMAGFILVIIDFLYVDMVPLHSLVLLSACFFFLPMVFLLVL